MLFLSRILVVFFICALSPLSVCASNHLDVVINEIAWMGTASSYNDEWIELYNNTDSEQNLSGWTLTAKNGSPNISLAGKIPPQGFYLLERTDDESVPGTVSDQIYTGTLENGGESLTILDPSGELVDFVDCPDSWFAGDNSSKQTMERKDPMLQGSNVSSWQNSQFVGGSPKQKNSFFQEENKALSAREENKGQKDAPVAYPSGVVLNELIPSPRDSDIENEWIEISNQNDFEVDLSGWWISDEIGKTAIYIIPKKTKLLPRDFLTLPRQTTKIALNNSGDAVNLVYPDGFLADSASYEKAVLGQSYARNPSSSWEWSPSPTPGEENIFSPQPKEEKSAADPLVSKKENNEFAGKTLPERLIKNIKNDPLLGSSAQISSGWEKRFSLKYLSTLLISLTTAVFSALIILSIKNKIKKREN